MAGSPDKYRSMPIFGPHKDKIWYTYTHTHITCLCCWWRFLTGRGGGGESGRGEGSRYVTMFSGQCTEGVFGRGRGFRREEEEGEEEEEWQSAGEEEWQSFGKRKEHCQKAEMSAETGRQAGGENQPHTLHHPPRRTYLHTINPSHHYTHLILRWFGGVLIRGKGCLGLRRGFGQSGGRSSFRVLPKLWVKLIDFTDCDIALQGVMWREKGWGIAGSELAVEISC